MPVAIIPDIREDGTEAVCFSRNQYIQYGEGMDDERVMYQIKLERDRDGRCTECGMQTNELRYDCTSGNYVKIPLSIPNEVHRGRCLLCFPIAQQSLPYQSDYDFEMEDISCGSDSMGIISPEPIKCMSRVVSEEANIVQTGNPLMDEVLLYLRGSFDITDILSAMKGNPKDQGVQEQGCKRLWILSWDEENSQVIGRVGGVAVILSAMRQFPLSTLLQRCASESLQNMAHNDFNRQEILELGAIRKMVVTMMQHMDCASIQQAGCTFLANMASNKVFHTHINDAGGYDAIAVALRRFPEREPILRAAYDALSALGFPKMSNA